MEIRDILLGRMSIEGKLNTDYVSIHLLHLNLTETNHSSLYTPDRFRLDLSISKRIPSKMRYDSWAAGRFQRPGKLFILPPAEALSVWNGVGEETILVCTIDRSQVETLVESKIQMDWREGSLDVASHSIERALLRMVDEVRNPGLATEAMVEALAVQIAIDLQRKSRRLSQTRVPPLSTWRLRRIEERLRTCDQAVNLSELADLCSLSVRQLSRSFLASQGISLGRYIALARAERAKILIGHGHSVKQIAFALGFSSSASFCAAFRNSVGMTPLAYRDLVHKAGL